MSTPTHTTTIEPAPATEPGALDGFLVRCDDCGPVASSSLRTLANEYAREHAAYMTEKDETSERLARAEAAR